MTDYHYHFVGNIAAGDDLDMLRNLPWDEGLKACVHHAWAWPVYCRFRDMGYSVSYSYELKPDAINFVHGEVARYQLTGRNFADFFIVGFRADFHPFPYANIEIVQNKQWANSRAVYMPHLPQPGLLSRDVGRYQVENICFSGQLENSGIPLERFENDLNRIGCRFVYKELGTWQDMRDVDVLLGIRSLDKDLHPSKPPTKLMNAWLSNIPFIGGYDSAFSQIGSPGEHYIRVSQYGQLLCEIEKLKDDQMYYDQFGEAGKQASRSYTAEKITEEWISLADNKINREFEQWKRKPRNARMIGSIRGHLFDLWEQRIRGYKRSEVWGC